MTITYEIDDNGVLEVLMDNPPVNALGISDTEQIATILNQSQKI